MRSRDSAGMDEPAASLWIRAGRAKERQKKSYVADWLIGFEWWLSRHPHPGSPRRWRGRSQATGQWVVSRLLVWLAPRSRRRQVESYDHAQHREDGGEVAAVIASSRRRLAASTPGPSRTSTPPLPPSSPPSSVQSIPMADPAAAKGGMMGGDVQRRSGSQRTEGWWCRRTYSVEQILYHY